MDYRSDDEGDKDITLAATVGYYAKMDDEELLRRYAANLNHMSKSQTGMNARQLEASEIVLKQRGLL